MNAQHRCSDLTADRLREVVSYDPDTGIFVWLTDSRRNPYSGRRAGSLRPTGYRSIRIDYRLHQEHRLAWLYVHGEFPEGHLDHSNGDPADNRICNLRPVTRHQNMANMACHVDSLTGLKGVSRHKRLGWFSRIMVNGKSHFLGYHKSPEAAHQAYVEASLRLHGPYSPFVK